jgi:flagellar biosynthesis/type III secretory pathway protein FliH
MSQTVTIQLEKPIASARLLSKAAQESAATSVEAKQAEMLEMQKGNLAEVCQALQNAINKVNEFQENIFRTHKEQIAKLSVEIARKILAQKAKEGDYEIEPIVEEALKNAPMRQDVVVHLNPEDLVQYQNAQQNDTAGALTGIKFVADSTIGRAECLLETPKGIIKSLIDEHLERVGQALEKAE